MNYSDGHQRKNEQGPTTPELEAWMRRTGAIRRHLRKFIVKGEDGYKLPVAEARITDQGEFVFTGDPAYAPSAEEKEKIEAWAKEAEWPKSIPASKAEAEHQIEIIVKEAKHECECIPFLDTKGEEVLFVEERQYPDDGDKRVLPWSYWNDGQWRRMEPDGQLPLYGLNRIKDASRIMIHEGAKAARDIQKLVDEGGTRLAEHPWGEALRGMVHLAWAGGAKRARDSDWEPIRNLPKTKRVIVSCDNDQGGIEAARTISKLLMRQMSVIRFGDAFSENFDMGDDFTLEKKLWEQKKGRPTWTGPSLEDCTEPATWATEEGEPEGKGRPPVFLRDEFAKEWMFSVKPLAFVNRLTMRRYAKDEFDVLVAPFADVKNVGERLHKRLASAAETLAYEPGKESGLIPTGRGMGINLYRQSDVRPVRGDTKLWHEFMTHLIPNEKDRKQLLRWIATLIARPSTKMQYSVLLISEAQGIGKTTLAEKIVMPLVGKSNCSFPTAHEATTPQFTSWLLFKRLAIIGEIYDGESSKAYNRLKGAITDDWVRAAEKYEKPFDVRNWIHVLGSSNSFRALKIAVNDRRWFVPEVTEEKWLEEKWVELNTWIGNEGLEAICHWAHEHVKQDDNVVQPGAEAPDSDAKRRSVIAAMSEGERIILDLGTALKKSKEQHVVRMDKIRTWLAEMKSSDPRYGNSGGKFLETPETIGSTLRLAGLRVCKRRFKEDKLKFSVVANFVIDEKEEWKTLKDKLLDPQKAYELDEELAEEKKQAEKDEPF